VIDRPVRPGHGRLVGDLFGIDGDPGSLVVATAVSVLRAGRWRDAVAICA
jgi:hypothetical protein